jgi:hypothetical protein
MTIAARITALWPATEARLVARTELDYIAAEEQAIADVIAMLYATYAPSADVPAAASIDNALVQQHVAELTVLQLMPAARDVYMQEAKRLSADVSDGVNAMRENSDYLAGLKALADELRASTAARTAVIAGLIREGTVPPTVRGIPTLFTVASGTRGL